MDYGKRKGKPMKTILILGAGFVARPTVRYLLEQSDVRVKLADCCEQKAQQIIGGHPNGQALNLDVRNPEALSAQVADADIVISLLPWSLHPMIARLCLQQQSHLVTASYVKAEMQAMDGEAREKGLLFLNEVGVDPGIDHMAAMKIIDRVKAAGGQVISFYSYCGGLPALESNNNPLGYKFSWSPEGAMLAATNDGRYLKDGQIVEVPGCKLFEHYWLKDIPGAGVFEAYVNRDALPYLKLYGIESARDIYRGTLRNIGYCETWEYFKKLGLLNRQMKFDFNEVSPRQVLANIINHPGADIRGAVADYLKIPRHSLTLKKLEWLGMFSDRKLPLGVDSVFNMFAHMLKNKLVYAQGEMDLLLQHHEFMAQYPTGKKEKIESTLIDTGIPNGDTSMSRTVGLPVGIAANLMAKGKFDLHGVHIPVAAQIYELVLAELKAQNITFHETVTEILD
jgi:saccharopine dehydrogenase-like NADP-dependent oxidoreductase